MLSSLFFFLEFSYARYTFSNIFNIKSTNGKVVFRYSNLFSCHFARVSFFFQIFFSYTFYLLPYFATKSWCQPKVYLCSRGSSSFLQVVIPPFPFTRFSGYFVRFHMRALYSLRGYNNAYRVVKAPGDTKIRVHLYMFAGKPMSEGRGVFRVARAYALFSHGHPGHRLYVEEPLGRTYF